MRVSTRPIVKQFDGRVARFVASTRQPDKAHSSGMRHHLTTTVALVGILVALLIFDRDSVVTLMDNLAIFALPLAMVSLLVGLANWGLKSLIHHK